MAVSGIPRKRITITVPVFDYEWLQELAKEKGITVTAYVRCLVRHHLWDLDGAPYKSAEPPHIANK